MWKIAIIDDDENLLEGMREAIPWEALDAEWVGEAIDGEEGLRLVRSAAPDIVITDINMPVMNGLEMIEILRREGYKGKMVILSGYSDFEYARQALRLQIEDYLSKPIAVDSLLKVMGDAIGQLEESRRTESEYASLKDRMSLYEPFVRQQWLKSVLTGAPQGDVGRFGEIRRLIERRSGQIHLVLGLELEIGNPMWERWERRRNLLRFAIQNVATEIADELFADYDYIEMHSHFSVILLHGDRSAEREGRFMPRVLLLKDKLDKYLREWLKINVRIQTGRIVEDWNRVSDSFKALFIPGNAADNSLRSLPFYQQLADAVRNNNADEAFRIIEAFVGRLDDPAAMTERNVKSWAGELWIVFAYSLYDVGIELESIFPVFPPVSGIGDGYTPADIQTWLTYIVSTIIDSQFTGDNLKHKQIADFIKNYVHEHYAEPITLGALADAVQISKNYLGQIFRGVMGESFNQYVTRIRMEKAKRLILEGNHFVYEIAEMVGYNNTPYFSSQFKKYIGVNPTDLVKK
ncbi:response regulator transcription factor [Cohnella hongkongensis]|uniref:Response regulator n=1 Tax=Cohnella hongkongensis TaxID=178337 RepID=A0ABV9FD25_9BACL